MSPPVRGRGEGGIVTIPSSPEHRDGAGAGCARDRGQPARPAAGRARRRRLVAFDTRKAVALLAHLALTDRPRPRDALADLLWPDTDPDRARGALRRTLSTLRAAVGAERVEATRDHVRLVKGPDSSVDVDRFRDASCRTATLEPRRGAVPRRAASRGSRSGTHPDFEDWVRGRGARRLRRELTATLADLAGGPGGGRRPGRRDRRRCGAGSRSTRCTSRRTGADPAVRRHRRPGGGARRSTASASGRCPASSACPPLAETTELYEAVNRGLASGAAPAPTVPPRSGRARAGPARSRPPFVGRGRRAARPASRLRRHRRRRPGRRRRGRGRASARPGWPRSCSRRCGGRGGAGAASARAYEDEAGLAYAPVVDALRARLGTGRRWLDGARTGARAGRGGAAGARARREGDGRTDPAAARRARRRDPVPGRASGTSLVAAAVGGRSRRPAGRRRAVGRRRDAGLLSYGLRRLPGRPRARGAHLADAARPPAARAAAADARAGRRGACVRPGPARRGRGRRAGARARARRRRDPAVAHRLWETTEGVPAAAGGVPAHARADDDALALPDGCRDAAAGPARPGQRDRAPGAVRGGGARPVVRRRHRAGRQRAHRRGDRGGAGGARRAVAWSARGRPTTTSATSCCGPWSTTRPAWRAGGCCTAAPPSVPGAPAAAVARHLQLAGRDAAAAEAYRRGRPTQARAVFANAEALGHLRAALALGHPDRRRSAHRDRRPADASWATTPGR